MSSEKKVVLASQPVIVSQIDWILCFICQCSSNEKLLCPSNSLKLDKGGGFKTFLENISEFRKLGGVPYNIDFRLKTACINSADDLLAHEAKWHKSCNLLFNTKNLKRKSKLFEGNLSKEEVSLPDKKICLTNISTRSTSDCVIDNICLFCNENEECTKLGFLHKVESSRLSDKIVLASEALCDNKVISKRISGDFVAIGAKYHNICLTKYFNRCRAKNNENKDVLRSSSDSEKEKKAVAFEELIGYMQHTRSIDDSVIFKLSYLSKIYQEALKKLDVTDFMVYSSRLKEKLMEVFPDLIEFHEGKEIFLVFKDDVGIAIKSSIKEQESEALIIAKAAKIIKREIKKTSFKFQGNFSEEDQMSCIPQSLLCFLKLILDGSKNESNSTGRDQAAKYIAQIIMFNTIDRANENSKFSRYNASKEQPLPIYLAFKLHSVTRKRDLIDHFHDLGLCISYQRYLTLSCEVANSVCTEYIRNDLVCPPQLDTGIFTTAAFDNVDHNTSSNFAKGSFHGTSISLMQHPNNTSETNKKVFVLNDKVKGISTLMSLPDSYAVVPSTFLSISKNINYTANDTAQIQSTHVLIEKDEIDWLDKVSNNLDNENSNLSLHWPAHHSLQKRGSSRPCTKIALLPLFLENAHSTSMILHSMNIIKLATNKLNPQQVPVITCDQPLFALAQQISLTLPETHGQKDFVFVFGGLHIEMTMMKTIGDYIAESGWTTALLNAEIFTKGKIDNVIHGGQIKQARYAHQVIFFFIFIIIFISLNILFI